MDKNNSEYKKWYEKTVIGRFRDELMSTEADHFSDRPNEYTTAEWEARTEFINCCKTMNDVAEFCREDGWCMEDFINFLYKITFDEEWKRGERWVQSHEK